jgi:hypothetical protein
MNKNEKTVHFDYIVDVVYLPENPENFEEIKILLWYSSKDVARFLQEYRLDRKRGILK